MQTKIQLIQSGLRYQSIDCYGANVAVICSNPLNAAKWAALLGKQCSKVSVSKIEDSYRVWATA